MRGESVRIQLSPLTPARRVEEEWECPLPGCRYKSHASNSTRRRRGVRLHLRRHHHLEGR